MQKDTEDDQEITIQINKTEEEKSCFEDIVHWDKTPADSHLWRRSVVKLKRNLLIKSKANRYTASDETDTINQEFEALMMTQANGYISELKGDTIGIASQKSSKRSQLSSIKLLLKNTAEELKKK